MSDEVILEGLPSATFMPVGRYKFKQLTDLGAVSLPIRGAYPEGCGIEGTYDICPAPGAILFGTLTQVMLALGKYPTLESNQRFVMSGLELDGDTIVVVGRVVELLEG